MSSLVLLQLEEDEKCNDTKIGRDPNLKVNDVNRYFALVFEIITLLYYFGFLFLYILRRQESPYLRKRLLPFVIITTFGFVYETAIWNTREYMGRIDFPCALTEPVIIFAFAFIATPVVIRVYIFYRRIMLYKYYSSQKFLKKLKSGYLHSHEDMVMKNFEINPNDTGIMSSLQNFTTGIRNVLSGYSDSSNLLRTTGGKFNVSRGIDAQNTTIAGSIVDNESYAENPSFKSVKFSKRKLRIYQHVSSIRFGWILFVISTALFGYVTYLSVEDILYCTGCENPEDRNDSFLQGALFFCLIAAVCIYSFFKIRKEPDPLHIKWELGGMLIVALVGIFIWAGLEDALNDEYLEGVLYVGYFLQLVWISTFFVMVPLQIHKSYAFDRNETRTNYNVLALCFQDYKAGSEIRRGNVTLPKVMESRIGAQAFKTFCVEEQALENLYFWTEATKFRDEFSNDRVEYNRSTFCYLFDIFIEKGSYMTVNIRADQVEALRVVYNVVSVADLSSGDVSQEVKKLIVDTIFDDAISEVEGILIFGPLSRFTDTADFERMFVEA
eukprot:snap_masked-scaffold_5-processed-gene-8.42-mRNA-1 protein AED:1.00 eAED:1.00 QI:0/-1/0/0/-1/1/1/0/552